MLSKIKSQLKSKFIQLGYIITKYITQTSNLNTTCELKSF